MVAKDSYIFLRLKMSLRVFHTRRLRGAHLCSGAHRAQLVHSRSLRGAHLCSGVHRAQLVHSPLVVDGRGVPPELGGGVVQVQPLAEKLHVGAAAGVHDHLLEVVDDPVLLRSLELRLEGEGAGLLICALHWRFELSLG